MDSYVFKNVFFDVMCMAVLSIFMAMQHMHAQCLQRPERVLESPGLQLQMVVTHHTGAENGT